jgi:hypothetical protein
MTLCPSTGEHLFRVDRSSLPSSRIAGRNCSRSRGSEGSLTRNFRALHGGRARVANEQRTSPIRLAGYPFRRYERSPRQA